MNTFQQITLKKSISEDKEEAVTQAETFVFELKQSPIDSFIEYTPELLKQMNKHHDITAKIS
jgi:hypothetical protein